MLQIKSPPAAWAGSVSKIIATSATILLLGLGGCALNTPSFGGSGAKNTASVSQKRYANAAPPAAYPQRRDASAPATPWVWSHTKRGSKEIIVQPGESLYGIATRHKVAISELMAANRLPHPAVSPGQRLVVPASRADQHLAAASPPITPYREVAQRPAPVRAAQGLAMDQHRGSPPPYSFERSNSYQVRPGDTLYSIARQTGVSARRLAAHNRLDDPSYLAVGRVLVIPR